MKLNLLVLASFFLSSTQLMAGDGRRGPNKTITYSGPASFNLSGEDGGNGRNGSNGSRGRCGTRRNSEGRTVRDDRRGGNGENGGHGGDGGNGGNLTILFTNVVDLKNITFYSYGGRGGRGGSGGSGGYGCPRGSSGIRGMSGSSGSRGSLFLVPQELHPYQSDTSKQYNPISELVVGRNIVKNIWEGIDGHALLAPNSSFGQSRLLKEYQYGSAKVFFKDPSIIAPHLLEETLYVTMNEGVTKIESHDDLLVAGTHSSDSPNAVLEIERLYKTSEFKSIAFETIVKKNNSLFIHLKTSKDLLPRPSLSMKLKVELKSGWFGRYHEIFNDEVPTALIEAINSGYHVDLEQLPLNRKIPNKGKIRLSMNYTLQEMDIKHSDEEIWVVNLNGTHTPEVVKDGDF